MPGRFTASRSWRYDSISSSDSVGCARDTIDGINMEVHKCDVDSWPSQPHAHDLNDHNRKISPDGKIWNTQNKKVIGKISKKALSRLASLFAKAMGTASLFMSATTFGDGTIYPGASSPGSAPPLPTPPMSSDLNPPLMWTR